LWLLPQLVGQFSEGNCRGDCPGGQLSYYPRLDFRKNKFVIRSSNYFRHFSQISITFIAFCAAVLSAKENETAGVVLILWQALLRTPPFNKLITFTFNSININNVLLYLAPAVERLAKK